MKVYRVKLSKSLIEKILTQDASFPALRVAHGLPPGAQLETLDMESPTVRLYFTMPAGDGVEDLDVMLAEVKR